MAETPSLDRRAAHGLINRASHAKQEDGVTIGLVQGIGKFPPSSSQRVTEGDMLGVLAPSGVAEAAGAVTNFHLHPAAGLKACQKVGFVISRVLGSSKRTCSIIRMSGRILAT